MLVLVIPTLWLREATSVNWLLDFIFVVLKRFKNVRIYHKWFYDLLTIRGGHVLFEITLIVGNRRSFLYLLLLLCFLDLQDYKFVMKFIYILILQLLL